MFADFWLNCIGRESLIAADDTWGLLAVLCVGVFISIWLEQKYQWASKISGAIIALQLFRLSNRALPSSTVIVARPGQ